MGFFRKTGALGTGKSSARGLSKPGRLYWAKKAIVWEVISTVHRTMLSLPEQYSVAVGKHFHAGT